MEKLKKCVIFDWDETLVDSMKPSYDLHCKVADNLGLKKHSFNHFLKFWGKSWSELIRSLWPSMDIKKFKRTTYKKFNVVEYNQFKPKAKDVIKHFHKKGYKLAIVSSRDKGSFPWSDPIMKMFDVVISEESKYHKPDPRVFENMLELCNKEGVNKKDIFYVGDLLIDYLAAKGAGINFICLINKEIHEEKDLIKKGLPRKNIIYSLGDLKKMI
jgi:phosphoglycolate phosphatase